MEKSANQLWRESGTSLSFKDWIQREKDKGVQIKNKLLENVVGSMQETDKKRHNRNSKIWIWNTKVGNIHGDFNCKCCSCI
jgi:hypothetical protein